MLQVSTGLIELDEKILRRGLELEDAGYDAYDALHLASAEAGGIDVLLTTGDKFMKRAIRNVGNPTISVQTP